MRVAFHTTVSVDKKESLADIVGRVRDAFLGAGLNEPTIRFMFADSSRIEKVSPVDRAVKRHPEMERLLISSALIPGAAPTRQLSNIASGEAVEFSTIQAIAAGVPRSYPFSGVTMHFYAPIFGERLIGLPKMGDSFPGVIVTDNRWINKRQRAISIYTVLEAQQDDKKLPPNPQAVDTVIKGCGKLKRTEQVSILVPGGGISPSIPPANLEAVKAVLTDYRARMPEILAQADLPHKFPPAAELRLQNAGTKAGPLKPALEAAFKPMGYACRGGSGQFHLTRRTAGHLTVELYLDVGTWSHSVSAIFLVKGAGFKASLVTPVAPDAPGQYPIGDAAQWLRIVENLAAMVRELDRGFAVDIERASGPSPAWYQPPS